MKTCEFLKGMRAKCDDELEALKARLEELEKINDESEDEKELKAAGEELDALKSKKAELEAELAEIDAQIKALEEEEPAPEEEQPQRKAFIKMEERKMNDTEKMERAATFKENGKMTITNKEARAVLVSSGKIATPTGVNGINETGDTISSIVDLVNVVDCSGMGANRVAYEVAKPEAGDTVEGEVYTEGDTTYAFKDITPKKLTTFATISEEVRAQSPLDYEAKVKANATIALKRAVSKYIIQKIVASDLNVALQLTAIDHDTLRAVALKYGGDESVNGNAVALLNKNTLYALGKVRGTSEKKAVYEITPDATNPNVGIIKDGGLAVKYVLNENIEDNTIVYGQAAKFELDLFGNYEVKVSEDFLFNKGLLAIRGAVQLGGDVVYKDGFIVAKVGA